MDASTSVRPHPDNESDPLEMRVVMHGPKHQAQAGANPQTYKESLGKGERLGSAPTARPPKPVQASKLQGILTKWPSPGKPQNNKESLGKIMPQQLPQQPARNKRMMAGTSTEIR